MKLILFIYSFILLKRIQCIIVYNKWWGRNVGTGGCRKTLGECVNDG